MEENKDEIVTEYNKGFFGKIRAFFGSIPGLVFLVGCALIFCGILMQTGYFTMSDDPQPSTVVSKNTSEKNTSDSDDESTSSSTSNVIVDGVEMTIVSGSTYTYGDYTVAASTLTSACDDSNNCELATNTVTLTFTDGSGTEYPFTLTPTNSSIEAGVGTIKVTSWGQDFVNVQIN